MRADLLHVICCISNPVRYRSRIELYKRFEKRVLDAGAKLYTIEAAFGERPFSVTEPNNPNHFQLRTIDELWIKENLMNIAMQRLPSDWNYVAFLDADIHFTRPDWAMEAVHLLQHYHVLQMWSEAQDLTPSFESHQTHKSFVYCKMNGYDFNEQGGHLSNYYASGRDGFFWHPGFGWAFDRAAMNHLGGLLDTAILGAADRHMAYAFYNLAEHSIQQGVTDDYRNSVLRWQERARYLWQDVGYMPGLILHDWHGKKKDRKYHDRWEILVRNKFSPEQDLTKDWQGLWQVRPERIQLRDDLRAYFRQRNEDSIDVD